MTATDTKSAKSEEDSDTGLGNNSRIDLSYLPPVSQLRWILFDLDMTLWDHDAAIRHAMRQICEELDHDFESFMKHYNDQSHSLWMKFSRGELDINDLRILRLGNVLRLVGDDRSDEEIELLCEHYLRLYLNFQGEMPGAYDVMCHASNHGKIGILTNATRLTQNTKIRQLQAKDLVSLVLTVDETGVAKTDPKFYQHAMKEMGNPKPESVLYVGDSWHDDVLPSQRLGWNIAWIDIHRKGMPENQPVNHIFGAGDLVRYLSE